jgi:hypothetical protein
MGKTEIIVYVNNLHDLKALKQNNREAMLIATSFPKSVLKNSGMSHSRR